MKLTIYALISLFTMALNHPNENELANEYIEKYKEIAISEMLRTGIPASIKIAQALHESGMGRSELATNANNHFGIKCGSNWTRETYSLEDDEYKNGRKIKSCFRKYNSTSESFIAHSDFLSNSNRYAFLFDYNLQDYKAWAHGLKKAGYATDPKYPSKLIGIIEQYNLYVYDDPIHKTVANQTTTESSVHAKESSHTASSSAVTRSTKSESDAYVYYKKSTVNEVNIIVASEHNSLRAIARDNNVDFDDLKSYNPDIRNTSSNLERGTIVYLEEKKISYKGDKKYHMVLPDETMEMISDRYGIKLEALHLKNRIPKDAQPFPGERVHLKGIIKLKNTPGYYRPNERKQRNQGQFIN